MFIEKKAYAKINLYLKILDKLENGYHNIYTVMQKISLRDNIRININQGYRNNIKIICGNENIPVGETNTAYKAADLFLNYTNINNFDIEIEIEKNIPSMAGLGGGSSDSACVLLGLNEYFDYVLPEDILMGIASKIGADVPFFVHSNGETNCAVCEGIGEIVTPYYIDLSEFYCFVVKPVYNISTKRAFEDWDSSNKRAKNQQKPPSQKGVSRSGGGWLHNDFSGLIFSQNKNIKEIKDSLIKSGAAAAEMTGSGSALFCIFEDLTDAEKCRAQINLRDDTEFCGIFNFLGKK
ncbi:MAG: 4-(cytidine 5'-diphospho)-2-C-methyl-D-erythritol kinase [Oscillospiraceae bacterium]|nr:4-(cytidine 5'-diphospho)-2-C-methyl-D-erythritol kinase [Oscillospiraceae bacterium]